MKYKLQYLGTDILDKDNYQIKQGFADKPIFDLRVIDGSKKDLLPKILELLNKDMASGEYFWCKRDNFHCLKVISGEIFLECPAIKSSDYLLLNNYDVSDYDIKIVDGGIFLPKGVYEHIVLSNGISYKFDVGSGNEVFDNGVGQYHAEIISGKCNYYR